MCLGWIRFSQDLQANARAVGRKDELDLLPRRVRQQFQTVAQEVSDLQMEAEKLLKQKNG
jgi:hypothetical protein